MPVEFKDYYKTLGVSKSATQKDIKKAFRDLARKCHPDLAKAEDKSSSEERFKEINEAYEVLKDPEKRKKYDRLGSGWDKYEDSRYDRSATDGPSGFGGFGGSPEGSPGGFEYHFGGTGFSDFFERYFGGSGVDPFEGLRSSGERGYYKTGSSSRRAIRGSDVEAEILITLEEAFKGSTRRLSLKKIDPVKGSEKSQSIDVKIPAGIQEGQRIRLGGQGQPSPDRGPPGDLFLKARFAQHPYFTVKGSDLHYGLNLAPWEIALGCVVEVPTLHGTARLTVKPGTQVGQQLRLAKHGLPKSGSNRGDLFVEIRIRMPESLSTEERGLWEKLKSISAFNPRAKTQLMSSDNEITPKWQDPSAADEVFDHVTTASMAGVPTRLVLKYWKIGLVKPIGDTERYGIYFDQEAIYLIRQAELMRQELSVDMRAATVIVKLRQKVEALHEELRFWRR